MTLQQLEYIVALAEHRQFSMAAAACHVAQPSLSSAVQKLEAELGVRIFDRTAQPLKPTEVGKRILEQAQRILAETRQLSAVVQEHCTELSGELRLGIIPTLAPYLLPLFLKQFSVQYPQVQLHISERTTSVLMTQLGQDQIDVALLATPLGEASLHEEVLFYEEFAAYAPHEPQILRKRFLLTSEIDPDRLVLLEEGHCLRNQVVNLCALRPTDRTLHNVVYEAGSLETLRRLVEVQHGITILPQLALLDLDEEQMQYVRFFHPPSPVREVSLVTRSSYARKRLLEALRQTILAALPSFLKEERPRHILPI